jgi:phenylpyruvate tautomerase PptA (4-oxalocrotonate tautomerase family)
MSLINAKACEGAFTEKQQHQVAARLTAVIVGLEGFVFP